MTALVAFLTLSAAAPLAAASPVAIDGVERVDRVLLPRIADPISLHVHALEALVVLEAPRGAAALARTLRMAPLALCPDLDETSSGVALHCRSRRIVARLGRATGGHVLDVSETRGLPWSGADGPPVTAFPPREIGLGDACPGSTPAGRAECLLARGDRDGAHALFARITDASAEGLPAVRLGDLAFAAGDVLGATSQWGRARGEPWERLAAARLCELSWTCIATADLGSLYAGDRFPPPIARELALRHARALAFLGRPLQGTQVLLGSAPGEGGCAAEPVLCRDIAGMALAESDPGSLDALALWVAIPGHERGPAAYRATVAAAGVAEREGAPIFAANLLAAAAGQVPARALRDHLLRTAELYLAGGDRVRAGVVLEFARARAGERGLTGPRWEAVAGAVDQRGAPAPSDDATRRVPATARPAGAGARARRLPARAAPALAQGVAP